MPGQLKRRWTLGRKECIVSEIFPSRTIVWIRVENIAFAPTKKRANTGREFSSNYASASVELTTETVVRQSATSQFRRTTMTHFILIPTKNWHREPTEYDSIAIVRFNWLNRCDAQKSVSKNMVSISRVTWFIQQYQGVTRIIMWREKKEHS